MKRIAYTITPDTSVIRLFGVARNPANGFPARPLGFGLFGIELNVVESNWTPGFNFGLQTGEFVAVLSAIGFYFVVLFTVGRLLQSDEISGQDLTFGPLQLLFLEMFSLAMLYMFTIIEELAVKLG